MRLRVLTVGRGGCGWADEAVADYARRMERWARVEQDAVRPEAFRGDVPAVQAAEATRLLKLVGDRDRLVALDERGRDLDTTAFTAMLEQARTTGVFRLVFALGGPYGHGAALRGRAHDVVRLSSLVLNHEVARVVLFEQLYRGLSVIHGVPYHH